MSMFGDAIWVIIFILLFVVFLWLCALIDCFYRVYQAKKHRRQHNIFEPDDYIIHDDELKVFAMWSSAVEGCAYIGYAYAENGEMAHKDEFRHATDAEIKAGRRLSI